MSFRALLARNGLSDQKRLLALLRKHVLPSQPRNPADINLRLVVAALNGVPGSIDGHPATTYEAICDFDTTAFASREALEGVFVAATASAALPVLFAPVDVDDIGPCIDGGTLNNTPMKWALCGRIGAELDATVVIATSVELSTQPPADLRGFGLVGHLAQMLIDERLYRDLRDAAKVNDALTRLDRLVQQGVLDAAQRGRVIDALGWTDRRNVQIVQIRPTAALHGSMFSGFFDAGIRNEHLDAGFLRGQEVLRGLGWWP